MQLADQLQEIADRHGGELTPGLVLDEARDPGHPLHSRFEWSDDVAAEKWRKHQASELIRSVMVQYRPPTATEEGKDVRAFVSSLSAAGHRVYRPVADVAADEFASALLLRDAEREWKALHRRYGHLAEFVAVVQGDVGDQAS